MTRVLSNVLTVRKNSFFEVLGEKTFAEKGSNRYKQRLMNLEWVTVKIRASLRPKAGAFCSACVLLCGLVVAPLFSLAAQSNSCESLFSKTALREINVSTVKTVAVVSASSSGALLAPIFKKHGIEVIHVRTKPTDAPLSPEDFSADVVMGSAAAQQLKARHVDLVLPGHEDGVLTADLLNHQLDLPYANAYGDEGELSVIRRQKFKQQERLREAGLNYIPGVETSDVDEARRFAQLNGWPIVVKPVDSVSSDGYHKCNNEYEVELAAKKLLGKPNVLGNINKTILVQKYVAGVEYALQGVVRDGHVVFSDIFQANKKILSSTGGEFYDRDVLVNFSHTRAQVLIPYVLKVLPVLKLENGPFHFEVKDSPTGPVLVEGAARLYGSFGPVIAGMGTGRNQAELLVMSVLLPEEFKKLPMGYRLQMQVEKIELPVFKEGYFDESVLDYIKSLPGYHGTTITKKNGEYLPVTRDLRTSLGTIDLAHKDPELLRETSRAIEAIKARQDYVQRK